MIRAVFYSIANLIFWDASACLALELIEGAAAELLVLSVCTLADSIAVPCQWYAPVLRWTKILVVAADFGTVIFVPMVFAIWSSIALPDAWDTSSWNEKSTQHEQLNVSVRSVAIETDAIAMTNVSGALIEISQSFSSICIISAIIKVIEKV